MEYNIYAVNSIIFVCIVLSLARHASPYPLLRYGLAPERILEKRQYYRLWSAPWIHDHWTQLLLNSMMLLCLGYATKIPLDTPNFLFVYLISAVGGNLLALYVSRDDQSGQSHAVGAAGGISGLLMVSLTLSPPLLLSVPSLAIALPLWPLAVAFLAVSLFALKTDHGTVRHDAHLGGAIVGLLLSPVVAPDTLQTTLWLAAALLLPSVVLFYALVKAPSVVPPSASTPDDGSLITQGWNETGALRKEHTFMTLEDEMNVLLDRINQSGYQGLSDRERERLRVIAAAE